ncbi:hypothetical protein [Streptosporangium sp. NPDC006007]|uniref:hypothetical protein n=1 Tax=Streptosporangium sp. NPDC006007 TaxID=3154575 RepID=UPI0033BB39F9
MKRTPKTIAALSVALAAVIASSGQAFAQTPTDPPIDQPTVIWDPDHPFKTSADHRTVPALKVVQQFAGSSDPWNLYENDPSQGAQSTAEHASSSAQICYDVDNYNQTYGYKMHMNSSPGGIRWSSPTYYGNKTGTCSAWQYGNFSFTALTQTFGYADIWARVWLYWN